MRAVLHFFNTKMGIMRGAVVLTSFQMVHASNIAAWTGTCNQLVSYKASPVKHKGAARPTRPIRGWKSGADKFQPHYCHSLTEWPWHVTFLYAPQL